MKLKLLLTAALCVGTSSVLANDYRVDVIVFLNQATPNGSPDEASVAISQFEAKGIAFGAADSLRAAGVQPLGDENFMLEQAWNRLRNATAFIPCLRASWVQPSQRRSSAPAVRLNDGVQIWVEPTPERRFLAELYNESAGRGGDELQANTEAAAANAAPQAQASDEQTAQPGDWALISPDPVQLHQLDGNITVFAQRYLHLAIDLWWLQHNDGSSVVNGESLPEEGARVFHIEEQRRVRLNELHYFDHPRFGVLAMVTRAGG